MSINYVQITPAEEQYAPPAQIIELAVVRALSSFGVGVQSWHIGDPPTQLPAPPVAEEPTA